MQMIQLFTSPSNTVVAAHPQTFQTLVLLVQLKTNLNLIIQWGEANFVDFNSSKNTLHVYLS